MTKTEFLWTLKFTAGKFTSKNWKRNQSLPTAFNTPSQTLDRMQGSHFEIKHPAIITLYTVIIARHDVIPDQSEHAHLYNHLSEKLGIPLV